MRIFFFAVGGLVVGVATGFAWGVSFDTRARPDWQAIAAIATFAAVGVALLPTFREAVTRRKRAMALRSQLGVKLIALRPTLISMGRGPGGLMAGRLSPGESRAGVQAVEGLFGSAEPLEPDEFNEVVRLLPNLVHPCSCRTTSTTRPLGTPSC